MSRTILLFNKEYQLIAEWQFGEHSVIHVRATPKAAPWSEEMALWKKTGIPYRGFGRTMDAHGNPVRGIQTEYAFFDSPLCSSALIDWAYEQGLSALIFSEERLHYWESVYALPLKPKDCYLIGQALEMTHEKDFSLFDEAIRKAQTMVQEEKEKTAGKIQKKVAGKVGKTI